MNRFFWFFTFVVGLAPAAARSAHPRLLWGPEDVPGLIARQSDPFYADVWNEVKIDGRSVYEGPSPSDTPNRSYQQAIISHGMIWLVSPNGVALDTRYQSEARSSGTTCTRRTATPTTTT